jgi:hypothetical protein
LKTPTNYTGILYGLLLHIEPNTVEAVHLEL